MVLGFFRKRKDFQGFKAKEIFANPVTSVGEVIISVTPKRPHDAVYSQGRVLADRRVLYKYINPNLISVITQGVDETKKRKYYLLRCRRPRVISQAFRSRRMRLLKASGTMDAHFLGSC